MFHVTNHTANDIAQQLKKRTIGQDNFIQEIASLATIFMNRQNMIDCGMSFDSLLSDTAFIVGPTGCGKTSVLRNLGEILDVDLTVIDCTQLTPAGYKGTNLDEALLLVLEKQRRSKGACQIVLFDEADKILLGKESGSITAENSFLMLLESPAYHMRYDEKQGRREECILQTDKIWFLFAGACEGIEDIVRKRSGCSKNRVGFDFEMAENDRTSELKILPEDLVTYGFKREVVGRFNYIITINHLTREDYKKIITHGEYSPLRKLQNTFLAQELSVQIDAEAMGVIADKTMEYAIGARAIQTVINSCILKQIGNLQEGTNQVVIGVSNSGELVLKENCIDEDMNFTYKKEKLVLSTLKINNIEEGRDISLLPWMNGDLPMDELLDTLVSCSGVMIDEYKKYVRLTFVFIIDYLSKMTGKQDRSTAGIKKLLRAGALDKSFFGRFFQNDKINNMEEERYWKIYKDIERKLTKELLTVCINAVEHYEREMMMFEKRW